MVRVRTRNESALQSLAVMAPPAPRAPTLPDPFIRAPNEYTLKVGPRQRDVYATIGEVTAAGMTARRITFSASRAILQGVRRPA